MLSHNTGMKRNSKFTGVLVSLVLIGSANLAVLDAEFADAASIKPILLKWKSQEIEQIIEPDSKFIPGKKLSAATLNKEARDWCFDTYFTFVSAQVSGASGKAMGVSMRSTLKTTALIVRANWQENEYGEDEFSLVIKCSGSFLVPVNAKSSSYRLTINWIRCCTAQKKDYVTSFITSPSFALEDLNSTNWVVSVELIVNDEEIDNGDYELSDLHIWRPQGDSRSQ